MRFLSEFALFSVARAGQAADVSHSEEDEVYESWSTAGNWRCVLSRPNTDGISAGCASNNDLAPYITARYIGEYSDLKSSNEW